MDLVLAFDPQLQGFDLALDGADLAAEDTLAASVLVSLLCDRLAASYEVKPGEDRRGWWADSYSDSQHQTGSRLWLLEREKQLPAVVLRCKQYCEEALQWLVDDGLAKSLSVAAFVPRTGALVAMIGLQINEGARTLRFEFDEARQVWRLAGEDL